MTSQPQNSTVPPYARVTFDPLADPAAVVVAGDARFTVLTSRLIRMEYDPVGRFEDRPSQLVWYRRQPVPPFELEQGEHGLTVTTEHLRLTYRGGPFAPESLSVTLLPAGPVWRYGDADTGNLRGTTRTLDAVDGPIALDPGLLSRDGWVVVDDSRTLIFDATGWLRPREADDVALDLYFLGYGRAHRDALRDYAAVTGPVPLLPRWALGNWWSRYWAYSDEELRRLMTEFRDHETPLSVCIIDMDWHLVDVGEGVSGWTGYTWNDKLFPDPPGFIDWLHGQGLRTALNLHPALGIRPHEAAYNDMCRRLGIDPATRQPIPFDIASPAFADAYFELLHYPQEEIGVDFWWLDWQQGTGSSLSGLDPLWWLNHLHFYDLGRRGRRPFIFSRWGGLGNHRYPIGFSGDTVVSWASLAFQPHLTAAAANVAYGWWSHDIGGHMQGVEDGELYARWVQYGVFSPIFRLHSTKNPFHERRPWGYNHEIYHLTRDAMQLRHAFIPYLYTMSHLDARDALSLCRPMYHDYPDRDDAYACPWQYLFGTELLVAPFTSPADPDTHLARQIVWLPPGDWYHFFSGENYPGDAWYALYGELDDIPVFARAGGIVPLGARVGWGGVDNPTELHLHVFAGAAGRFDLYEDDGETTAYREGAYAISRYEQNIEGDALRLTLAAPEGDQTVVPDGRRHRVYVYGLAVPGGAILIHGDERQTLAYAYDPQREVVQLELPPLAGAADILITAAPGSRLLARRDRLDEKLYRMLACFRLDTVVKSFLAPHLSELRETPERLADFGLDMTPSQLRALLEVALEAGGHYAGREVAGIEQPHLVVLWNNRETPHVRHTLAEVRPVKWFHPQRYGASWGVAPRFAALRPESERWQLRLDYAGLMTIEVSGEAN